MKTAFLYDATIKTPAADEPLTETVVYRGVDQARLALAAHFRVPIADIKVKLQRTPAGAPIEVLCETTIEEDAEQCWAGKDRHMKERCPNKARPGFHTCKIHTAYSAPFPVGTPEFDKWADEPWDDDPNEPAAPRKRRSRATRAPSKGTTPKTTPKPAKRRSGARRKPETT